mgnify:CR=1 FL=1|tara:strand:+ start:1079 stop:1264 length:186 start_codon:yes stop_codon:yes gene_type:complete
MKTIKECKTIEEAIVLLKNIILTSENKKKLGVDDEKILLSNLYHDLDDFLNYEKSEKRKNI